MDCGGDRLCRRVGKESATVLKKAVVRPDSLERESKHHEKCKGLAYFLVWEQSAVNSRVAR